MAAMTVQQIYDYANVLTEDSFSAVSEVIEWMNEAQDIIARYDSVEATPVEYTLDEDHEITLPDDFMMAAKFKWEDTTVNLTEAEIWDGVMTLPTCMTSGTLKMYYYKHPDVLLSTTLTQVPEVSAIYHRAMAKYIAKMFHLVDDDQALRAQFEAEFAAEIQSMKMPKGNITTFHGF